MDIKKLYQIAKKSGLEPMLHENHATPKTRRELVSQGFIAGSSFVWMPSLVSMLAAKNSYGQASVEQCSGIGKVDEAKMTPVVMIDCRGGVNIAGNNIMVGKQGGQEDYLDPGSYESLGIQAANEPTAAGDNVVRDMGFMWSLNSGMLRGVRSIAPKAIRDKCQGVIVCAPSDDDSSNNEHNPNYWLYGGGLKGSLVHLIGTEDSPSGGNSMSPRDSINPAVSPVRVRNDQQATDLVASSQLDQIVNNQSDLVMKFIKKLSASQLQQFSEQDVSQQIKTLVECGYVNSERMMTEFQPEDLQAGNDDLVTALRNQVLVDEDAVIGEYNVPNEDNDGTANSTETIAKLVLNGYAGNGTIEIGGCDYHNNGKDTQENKDFQIGRQIGRIIALASAYEKDVVIYVFSDGGVAARPGGNENAGNRGTGKFEFQSDSGQRSSTFMIAYKHAGGIKLRSDSLQKNGKTQVGGFNNSGGVDSELAGNMAQSPANISAAFIANYLALHGMEGNLEQVIGGSPFDSDELDKILCFDKSIG